MTDCNSKHVNSSSRPKPEKTASSLFSSPRPKFHFPLTRQVFINSYFVQPLKLVFAEQRKSIFPLHMNSRKAFSPSVIKILAYIPVKCHSFSYKYQRGVICISTTCIVNLQKDGRFSRTLRYTQERSHLLGRYPRLRSVIEITFYFGNWTL